MAVLRSVLKSMSQRTATFHLSPQRPLTLLAITYLLAPLALAENATVPLSQSGCSAGQASCKSTPYEATKPSEATLPERALAEARSLLQKGLLAEAESTTRQILRQHADSAEGHYLLGHILFDEIRKKYVSEEQKEGENFRYTDTVDTSLATMRDAKARESLAELSAGARYRAPGALDLKTVGLNYLLLKNLPAAEKWLTASLTLDPQDPQAWYYLGRTKYSQTKYVGAIEAFEHCLKVEPENVSAEYNVGLSYEGLKQNEEATQAYQNAIAWAAKNKVDSLEASVALARLYLHQNQPDKALPYLMQAVAASPEVSLAHEELGKAYSTLHRLAEAEGELEKAVQLAPHKAPLRCLLGRVYEQEKMAAKAQSEFDRCSALKNAGLSLNSGAELR